MVRALLGAAALAAAACRSGPAPGTAVSSPPAPRATPAPRPSQHPSAPGSCPLDWDQERESLPPSLPLATWQPAAADTLADECPPGFDAADALTAACSPPDCFAADLAPGHRAALLVFGPEGSGRFFSLGLAVGGSAGAPRFACIQGSTVGWRHFAGQPAARSLAPLPWLSDLDGDGAAELIVWQRVSWGSSEIDNGLIPAVYQLDGVALVRRDAAGVSLARRVAAAYRSFIAPPAGIESAPGPAACYGELAAALDRWGAPR